jgi:hypothetical protein
MQAESPQGRGYIPSHYGSTLHRALLLINDADAVFPQWPSRKENQCNRNMKVYLHDYFTSIVNLVDGSCTTTLRGSLKLAELLATTASIGALGADDRSSTDAPVFDKTTANWFPR